MNRIRPRVLVVGVLAALGVILSIAVVSADHAPTEIILVLEDGTNLFRYGEGADQKTQPIEIDKAECAITDDSRTGWLIEMSATTYNNGGNPVAKAPIGLVEDGLGVNLRGNGNGQECGRVDYLGDGTSERLRFSLGDAVTNQMLSAVTFDFEAKYEPVVHFWFWRGPILIDDYSFAIGSRSDSGPDSKYLDKYKVLAYPGCDPEAEEPCVIPADGELFDAIEISMESGGVSVEGGATWEFTGDPSNGPGAHRTVFHLKDAAAGADIADTTSGDVDGMVAAGDSFTWSWTVTNTGDLGLSNLSVDVSIDGAEPPVSASCDPDTEPLTSLGVITCSLTATAPEDGFDVEATFTGTSPYGGTVTDSVTESYFGVVSGINVDALTNGVEGGSDFYIAVGDPVVWTYVVTNTGNAALSGVSVSDDQGVTISGPTGDTITNGKLDPTETWVFTATPDGEAEAGPYENTATVSATDPFGGPVGDTDSSGYFGSAPGISIEVNLEDPLISSDEFVRWEIIVANTGNVDLEIVTVKEDGSDGPIVCPVVTIAAGADPVTCYYSHPPEAGYTETSFLVEATDPLGGLVEKASGSVSYIGVLDCGEGDIEGEPGLADTPLVSFIVGPDNETKPEPACSVPVHITSSVGEDGSQTVGVEPPAGYSWGGVTGVVTIQWDAEDATLGPIARTYEVLGTSSVPIPWCAQIVGVSPVQDGGSDLWYYDLNPTGGLYPSATAGGNTCLISQHTENVDDGGVIRTQTTEVFYIWNDPIFLR